MSAKAVLVVVGSFVGALAIYLSAASELAVGQVPATTPPAAQKPEKPAMPEVMEHMKEMKEKMKMSPDTMMGCCMMMCMEVKGDDPAAMLALKEQLKLTPAQMEQLKKIVAEARENAGKVLTADQKKVLEPLAKKACSMMEMHHDMMHKMGRQEKGQAMMCPMMKVMEAMEHKDGVKESTEEEDKEHGDK